MTVDELSAVTVTFEIEAPEEAGDYTVRIEGLRGTFRVLEVEVEEEVVERKPRIESISVEPALVEIGKRVTISVVVVSEADVETKRDVTVTLDGVLVETRTVTLGPRERRTESFDVVAPSVVGRHEVAVGGLVRAFEVKEVEEEVLIEPAALNLVAPLTVSPTRVVAGGLVSITVVIENEGDEAGETELILRVNRREVERKTVRIPGREELRVRFEVVGRDAGDYTVELEAPEAEVVRTLDGTFKVVAPNLILVPGTLTVEPETVEVGKPVIVSIDIRNEGDARGTRTVVFRVDGRLVEEREVTLAPGARVTVTSTHVEEDVGAHTVSVEGLEAEFTATEEVLKVPNLVVVPGTLTVEPETIEVGETVTVSIDIRNEGDAIGPRTVTLRVDGVVVDTQRDNPRPG